MYQPIISEFRSSATEILKSIRPNSTFLTVKQYMNNFGELSDFSICFHIDYLKSVARAKELLEAYKPVPADVQGRPYSFNQLMVARDELVDSYNETLSEKRNSRDTSSHAYDLIISGDGPVLDGVKLHWSQDILHVYGFQVHKKTYMKGNYPPDKRRPLTIAKDDLRRWTPLGNFRQFKLANGKFHKLVVEKMTIREQDAVRNSHAKLIKQAV